MAKRRPKKPRVTAPKTREKIRKAGRRINDLIRKIERADARHLAPTIQNLETTAGIERVGGQGRPITTGDPTRPRVKQLMPKDMSGREMQTHAKRLAEIEKSLKSEWEEIKKNPPPKPTPAPQTPSGITADTLTQDEINADLNWWDDLYDEFSAFYDSKQIGEMVSEFDSRIDVDPAEIWQRLLERDPDYLWSVDPAKAREMFTKSWQNYSFIPEPESAAVRPDFLDWAINDMGQTLSAHPDFDRWVSEWQDLHPDPETWPDWM